MNGLIELIIEFFNSLFNGTPAKAAEPLPAVPAPAPVTPEPTAPQAVEPAQTAAPQEIDWTDGKSMVSKHFSVKEAITLHSWDRLANEADGLTEEVKLQIVKLCKIMDEVRDAIGVPMSVHCIFRSVQYNREVLKSLPNDVHAKGEAIDFDCNSKLTIEQTKEKIRPLMEKLEIRMEGGTATWIHLDTRAVGPSGREFKA